MTQEALKLALEALEKSTDNFPANVQHRKAITAIKEALAQPEQEPVAYTNGTDVILAKYWTADYPPEGWEPLGYTTPSQRIWVGLVFCIVRVVSEIESKGLKPIVEKIWYGPQKENNT